MPIGSAGGNSLDIATEGKEVNKVASLASFSIAPVAFGCHPRKLSKLLAQMTVTVESTL